MAKLNKPIKKILAIGAIAISTNLAVTSQANAATPTELLEEIVNYTYYAAESLYYVQQDLLAQLNSWIMPDTSDTTSKFQGSFTTLTNTAINNANTQPALQPGLLKDFMAAANNLGLDYTYDYTYQTMIDKAYASTDPRLQSKDKSKTPPDAALNYLKNVSGMNILHPAPDETWQKDQSAKENYKRYFTTVSAIQTYDAYVLSDMYQNAKSDNPTMKQQHDLMQMASNSTWFSQIAGENIGTVLRQILMFNSQNYVLMTQLLETQKQQLAAQVMANTLLVLGNKFTENQLIYAASGAAPK